MDKSYRVYKPACLCPHNDLSNTKLQVTGWGTEGYLGPRSIHLLKATLSLVDHRTCARRYKSKIKTRKLKLGILEKIQICAGDAEGSDTCEVRFIDPCINGATIKC